jgi:squalene synthase HpnC
VTTRSLSYTTDEVSDLPSPEAVLRRAGAENFPVAPAVLPKAARRHLIAFYGFARLVDEVGDSYAGDRLAALDWIERETEGALSGAGGYPLIVDASRSVRDLGLDPGPLFALIEANRMDQRVSRYETFDDLVGYCRLSANPVGHLVLGALGYSDEERRALSDSICTGLQLVEHWQDVAEDAAAGRIYLPAEDLDRFGVDPDELTATGPAGTELRGLMIFEVSRARRWLDSGRPLIRMIGGRARIAVAGFWAGGHAALDEIAARGFDVKQGPAAGRNTVPAGPRRVRLLTYLAKGLWQA